MCGIAGCFGAKDTQTVNKMLDALPHRGPDDRGLYANGQAVLGHTRLSIVDVAGGHQPILAPNHRYGIIANGEIYNFRRLRDRYLRYYDFQTRSDTEVILRLYQEKGPQCVKYLDGMFAFAIMDGDNFMLARDPLGIKPLYHGHQDGNLYVCSEVGPMTEAGIEDIHEFPNGYYYTPQEEFVPYYQLPARKESVLSDVEDISQLIRDRFVAAVKKRLLADSTVPVGSFCSGGLDSSLIAAIAAEDIPNLHTFVVGMENEHGVVSDDLKASRQVAAHIGSNHHELIFTEQDYYAALPTAIRKLESYDPSLVRCAVPCYFTSKLASEFVTVALTGEGADELFSGYHYMKHYQDQSLHQESADSIRNLHNLNLQRADRMGMLFSLELRVPFLDTEMIDLAMHIPPELKIRETAHGGKIEKWILRHAFADTGYLPDDILWRYKVQYTQGAGCESVGAKIADQEMSDAEYAQLREEAPDAGLTSKEAAYYYKIFRGWHPQVSVLQTVGMWAGFDFAEERAPITGTVDGELRHPVPCCV